jgi:DNA polymerase-1
MPTLYLIDGYAQFFRAYHALRTPMTSPVTKEPTNMSFGFLGMLLKLLRGQEPAMLAAGGPPDYLAVVIDVSGDKETFRSELYPEYKANRQEPPDDLFPQVERCLAALRDVGVPVIGAAGFEADDAIAALVDQLGRAHPELTVRIISKDKDLKQLLRAGGVGGAGGAGGPGAAGAVEMYDIHTDVLTTVESLKADTGLAPGQVVDMLALMGDTVDNVPGVEGVGPKTAAELITRYSSLDNLIAHAGEIPGKRGERLREAIPRLALSKRLVTLRPDTPVSLDLEAARVKGLKLDRLIPVFKELGFNRYQDETRALLGQAPVMPASTGEHGAGAPAAAPAPAGAKPASRSSKAAASGPVGGGLFDHLAPEASGAGAATLVSSRPHNPNYRTIRTARELSDLIATLAAAPIFAIDTETTGVSPLRCELCGISVSVTPDSGYYIPVRCTAAGVEPEDHLSACETLDALRPILEDATRPKCGHNLKFDMLVLRAAQDGSVHMRGGTGPGGFDSMIASYLIDASRSSHGLDSLALALLNHTNIPISELIGTGSGGTKQRTFDTVDLALATQYAAEDADVSLRLRETMLPQLRAMDLMELFEKVEMPVVDVLAELEYNGILVDPAELDRQRDRLSAQIAELRRKIDDAADAALGRTFNPDSPKQLASALFNKPSDPAEPGLGIKPPKRTKTGFSTDSETLELLTQDASVTTPIPQLILDYRQLTKLVSTYLVSLKEEINPRTGRIHASFNQTVAATGRLSSSDPNLQNIPIRTDVGREIRKAFIAPPGHVLIAADYSQIELRLLAHLSKDPALTEAFLRDEDIHTAVAAQIHHVPLEQVTREQRSGAKMVNFGIVYGITSYGLARRLGIHEKEAAQIIDAYKRRFAGITTFLQECIEQARRFGYVETMFKRRRPIPDIHSNNPSRRSFAERTAINSVVQGSAADLIKAAMVDLHGRITGGSAPRGLRMLLQIHDELVFECPAVTAQEARVLVVERMEKAMTLSVPLKVDSSIADNWFEGK